MKKIKEQRKGRRAHRGENVAGVSPFGMSRKFRRALFASVRDGTANQQEVDKFKSLGKDAYPWMGFREIIKGMVKRVLKK